MFFHSYDVVPFLGQIAFGLLLFFLERTGRFQLAYSKFRRGGNMNARVAMFLIYFPAPVIYAVGSVSVGLKNSTYHDLLFYAFMFHFWKRCVEIVFIHRYSRPMGLGTVILIGFLYGSIGWTAATLHGSVPRDVGNSASVNLPLIIGGAIFVVGQVVNFYHHWLLARLRDDGSTDYKVPQGGLFAYVVCPHYLGEILAWLGYAIASGFLPVFGIACIMTLYLTGRSLRTVEWYREKVPGFPADRRALIPRLL